MPDDPPPPTSFRQSLERPFPNSVAQKSLVAGLLIVVLLLAVLTPFTDEDDLARGGGVAAIAVLSFIVFFQGDAEEEDRSQALRRAVTGGTVLTFLVVFALSFFHDSGDRPTDVTNIRSDLLTDFRWVVVSVVAFYFGTDAVHRYLSLRYGTDDDSTT